MLLARGRRGNSPSARESALDLLAKLREEDLITVLLVFTIFHVEIAPLRWILAALNILDESNCRHLFECFSHNRFSSRLAHALVQT